MYLISLGVVWQKSQTQRLTAEFRHLDLEQDFPKIWSNDRKNFTIIQYRHVYIHTHIVEQKHTTNAHRVRYNIIMSLDHH